jgi:hypothetical protein
MGNRGILNSYLKDAVKEVCNAAGHTVSMEVHCFPRDPTERIDLLAFWRLTVPWSGSST